MNIRPFKATDHIVSNLMVNETWQSKGLNRAEIRDAGVRLDPR